jgi:hypothetical protein
MKKLTVAEYQNLSYFTQYTEACRCQPSTDAATWTAFPELDPQIVNQLLASGHLRMIDCRSFSDRHHYRLTTLGRTAISVYEFCRSVEGMAV